MSISISLRHHLQRLDRSGLPGGTGRPTSATSTIVRARWWTAAIPGGFNPGPFDGSQYALKSTASDAAFTAGGDLHTQLGNPSHTPWGKLDSIALGDTPDRRRLQRWLRPGQPGGELQQPGPGFADRPGPRRHRAQGGHGLMSGDSSAPQGQIDALLKAVDPSLSINSTFDQLAAGRRRPCHPRLRQRRGNRRGRRAGTAARPGPGGWSNCPR